MSTTTEAETVQPNRPWCQTVAPDPFMVGVYWIDLTIFVTNIILGAIGTYKLVTMKDNNAKPIIKVLWIIITSLFIMSPAGFAFVNTAGWECWYGFEGFVGWEATIMVGVTSYHYGLAVLCYFFFVRLKTIFNGTSMGLHKVTLVIMYLGLLIQAICPIIACYFFMQAWDPVPRLIALRVNKVFTFTNVAVNTLILILFTKRILLLSGSQTVISTAPSSSEMSVSSTKDTDGNMEKVIHKKTIEREMLSLAVKYMVCASLAVSSSLIRVIWGILRSEVEGWNTDLKKRGVGNVLTPLDGTVNMICLYLQFSFNQRAYSKCCCCIDKCFQICFVKLLSLNVKENKDQVDSKGSSGGSKGSGPTVEIEMSI